MALKKYHGWIVQKIFQVRRPRAPEASMPLWGEAGALRGPVQCACAVASVAAVVLLWMPVGFLLSVP